MTLHLDRRAVEALTHSLNTGAPATGTEIIDEFLAAGPLRIVWPVLAGTTCQVTLTNTRGRDHLEIAVETGEGLLRDELARRYGRGFLRHRRTAIMTLRFNGTRLHQVLYHQGARLTGTDQLELLGAWFLDHLAAFYPLLPVVASAAREAAGAGE